jgi:hypothetical protein
LGLIKKNAVQSQSTIIKVELSEAYVKLVRNLAIFTIDSVKYYSQTTDMIYPGS